MRDLKSSAFRAVAILLLVAATVFLCIALIDTAFVTTDRTIPGYWVLLTGWMGFVIFQFSWYSNLLSLMAILLLRRHPWRALICSAFALLVMSQSFWFLEIPRDTSGNTTTILSRGAGFYCWIAFHISIFYSVVLILVYRAFQRDFQQTNTLPSSILVADNYNLPTQSTAPSQPLSYPKGAISTPSNP